jgi:hypothetical protein
MFTVTKSDREVRNKNEIRPCQECSRPIDPVHYCENCQTRGWCGKHDSPYRRASAKFCSKECRDKAGDRRRAQSEEENLKANG